LEVPTASPADDLILSEFLASAVVVLGAPMYNFSIPSQLKVWIDRIVIPGKTFQYTREGPKPVLRSSQKIIVASACGDNYGSQQSAPMDEMESYLRHVFGFIGVDDVCVIRAEGVALHRADVIAEALRQFDRNN
jgi:FMN-dependent NADH-azoreductase